MRSLPVVFSARAERQLDDLFEYIEGSSGRGPAETYVAQIISFCIGLGDFPERGTRRDDLRPGVRTVGFRKRATVVFAVRSDRVAILGVFYGGQDFEAVLREEPE